VEGWRVAERPWVFSRFPASSHPNLSAFERFEKENIE